MENNFSNIGGRIITRLKELGIKQIDLCRKTGLSTTAISQYCTGKRVPDTAALYKIATVLETSMEWIITGKNSANENYTPEVCNGAPLTDLEADLIIMFRLLDEADRKTIFDLIKLKYEQKMRKMESDYLAYSDIKKKQIQNKCGHKSDSNVSEGTGFSCQND